MKNRASDFALLLGVVLATLVLSVSDARAQRRAGGGYGAAGSPEISVTYGSMWGGHIETVLGTFRVDTAGGWTVAASVPFRAGSMAEFSYTRQDSRINLDTRSALTNLTDMTVNYWQLGTVQSIRQGKVTPYVIGTLGLTYYSPEADSIEYEATTYRVDSSTKFSMTFGVGFKAAMGSNEKISLRAQFRVMPTLYDASAGMWVGTGGGGVSVSGSAIWQYEAAAGLSIKLGQ